MVLRNPALLSLTVAAPDPSPGSWPDPVNVYRLDPDATRPLGRAAFAAILLHVLLLLLVRWEVHPAQLEPVRVLEVLQLAVPNSGAGPALAVAAQSAPTRLERPLTIPAPQPIELTARPAPSIPRLHMTAMSDLGIGEIEAPASRSSTGPGPGPGGSERGGGHVFEQGAAGITPPRLIQHTTPTYTDAAIQARAAGTVLISAVIRPDGSITDLRVLRGLGYGLEEAAIEEIARHWRFLPGRRNGIPVSVRATIEVSFALR